MKPFSHIARDWNDRAARWRRSYGRTATWTLTACLASFGVVAFAVAPLAPDAADLPQFIVSEEVSTAQIEPQLEALAGHSLELSQTIVTRPGVSLATELRRLGVSDAGVLRLVGSDAAIRKALDGRGPRIVQVRTDGTGGLIELIIRSPAERAQLASTHFTRTRLRAQGDGWIRDTATVPVSTETRLASGTITSSLFAATDEARIPDKVATQLAEIFAVDIDFHRELRRGDTFSLVYEALTADGEPVPWNEGAGRVLAAEFVNGGTVHQAIWFESGGRGAYFDPSGRSRKRVFLASPVEFSRITSGFALRMHPILKRMRAHNGVDYAAPTGTPVRTVGGGTVDFAGWQNGFGQVVFVRHDARRTTVYAHLSRINVRKGQRVEQGDQIGAVGSTGWATGPHLHFEFRVGGVHQDPLKIAKSAETVRLDAGARPRFEEAARAVQAKLEAAESVGGPLRFE